MPHQVHSQDPDLARVSSVMIQPDHFLVCGLGSLGQHCVHVLKKFGVRVSAVTLNQPQYWDIENTPELLEDLVIGDCRQPSILEKISISRFRAVLLVTSDERVNIEAAFVARLLNPDIRLVVRSAQSNLNELLGQQLGDFVAFEPTELTAPAFALAAMGDQTKSCFYLEDQLLQVMIHQVERGDPLCGQVLEDLNKRSHRLLSYCRKGEPLPQGFYNWDPETRVQAGDTLVYIEVTGRWDSLVSPSSKGLQGRRQLPLKSRRDQDSPSGRLKRLVFFFQERRYWRLWRSRAWRVAMICLLIVFFLLFCGSLLFYHFGSGLNLADSVYATVVLMLGGYSDLLGGSLHFSVPIPWWLRLFSLLLTITGTILVGALYALLTGSILAARFHFIRRSRPPQRDHVILVGLGRVGRKVADMLDEFQQPLVGVTKDRPGSGWPTHLPLMTSDSSTSHALEKANLMSARSVISVTDDEMVNLEICLLTRRINPSCSLVLRTYHKRFSDYVAKLFPYAQVLCSSALAAEAFAAAAFGENVPSLFYQNDQTILVTQYYIQSGDTLNGRLLSEIAYGYEVVPIVLTEGTRGQAIWMPSDDNRLQLGDHLTVLATTDGLRRVEKGELMAPAYSVQITGPSPQQTRSEGAAWIARIAGCSMETARKFLEGSSGTLSQALYHHQGHRLARILRQLGIEAELTVLPET